MVTHERISLDDPVLWRSKLGDLDHGFGYTWEHCHAMGLTTGLKAQLYCFESEDVRIVCPFSERVFDGHVDIVKPYGFSGFAGGQSHAGFAVSFRDFVRDMGYVCGYLGVDPLQNHDFGFDLAEAPQHGSIHVLDLSLSERELFGNLSTNRRRQLRHTDKMTSTITEDQPELGTFFLEHYPSIMRGKEAASFYHFTKETLAYLLALDNVFLIGAQEDNGVVAVSVFAYTGTVGEYLFNVSDSRQGRQYSTALIWQGIRRLQSLGVKRFNLGGSYSSDGVLEYKRRFGGKCLALRSLRQIYDRRTFDDLCRRTGHPGRASRYFPPYWQPVGPK